MKSKINKNKVMFIILIVCGIFISILSIHQYNKYQELQNKFNDEVKLNNHLTYNISEYKNLIEANNQLIADKDKTIQDLQDTCNQYKKELNSLRSLQEKPTMKQYKNWNMYWEELYLEDWEIDFFAKLLKAESGSMGYDGQLWTASAIINYAKRANTTIYQLGHNINAFAVAPFVDNVKPDDFQYQIIYNILENGWIKDVCYFRTDYPHDFGHFMTQIENVFFSCP